MSSVKLKKILNNHGIPPGILRYQTFWDTTLLCVESWVEHNFHAKGGVELLSRQVVRGPEALKSAETNIPFIYRRRKFSGMCFIGLNRSLSEAFAANRLNENEDRLTDISNIFLGLICESAASSLWESLAFQLLGESLDAPQPSTTEFAAAEGGFKKTCRYLVLTYTIQLPGGGKEIQLIFTLDAVRDILRQRKGQNVELGQDAQAEGLRDSFLKSKVNLSAVLDTINMSLGECMRLERDQTFRLPNVEGREVKITVDTLNGVHTIAAAQIGAWRTHRAVKFTTPIAQDFANGLGVPDLVPVSASGS